MLIRRDRFAVLLAALALTLPGAAALAMPTDGGVPQRYTGYDPNLEYRAGLAALLDSKYRDAKQHFNRVLMVMVDNPVALWRLGEAEDGLGDLKGAVRDYQASLKEDPKQIRAASELGVDEEKLGRRDAALAQLRAFQHRSAACADTCPEAEDLQAAIRNIRSVLPAGADAAPPTP